MSMIRHLGAPLRLRASACAGLRIAARRFSTETVGGEQLPPPPQEPSTVSAEGEQRQQRDYTFDPFLQGPGEGLTFGRLTGIGRNTMKTDVIHFFEGCNLSSSDVKVEYNKGSYLPTAMMLRFPSQSSFDTAVRQTIRKGRLYNINRVDRGQWDLTASYDGKTVLLQGIPRAAFQEDIERFLSGCNYDPSAMQIIQRNIPEPVRLALIKFPTPLDAMNAFSFKNRGFCLNNSIIMRVLH